MNLRVFQDFEMFDIGTKANAQKVSDKIDIVDQEILLDTSNCIIDYPATSIIIDKILYLLARKEGKKKMTITTDLVISELLLLQWLFVGSQFLEINETLDKNNPTSFYEVFALKLPLNNILITVRVIDNKDNIIKEFCYGK